MIYAVGQRFSSVVILGLIPDRKNPKALCVCDCGNIFVTQRGALGFGKTTSCGCVRTARNKTANLVHGMSRSKTYSCWSSMMDRCFNKKNKHFKNYGGRGITVCDKWRDFSGFYADMGEIPTNRTIERTNNNGNYEHSNCCWKTRQEQLRNTRRSKRWTINGTLYETSTDAAKALGVSPSIIVRGCNGYARKGRYYPPRAGWSCEKVYSERRAP